MDPSGMLSVPSWREHQFDVKSNAFRFFGSCGTSVQVGMDAELSRLGSGHVNQLRHVNRSCSPRGLREKIDSTNPCACGTSLNMRPSHNRNFQKKICKQTLCGICNMRGNGRLAFSTCSDLMCVVIAARCTWCTVAVVLPYILRPHSGTMCFRRGCVQTGNPH